MFAALRGVVLALFLAVNTIAWASLTFLAAALRLVLPARWGGDALRRAMNGIIDGRHCRIVKGPVLASCQSGPDGAQFL